MTTVRAWILVASTLAASPLAGQDTLRLARVYGEGDLFLFGVVAGSGSGPGIAVLTDPEPAVHRFSPAGAREWGREGNGPAELRSPADIVWQGRWVHVLDLGSRKIVRFDREGGFHGARNLGGFWANRLEIVGADTLLGAFTPMTGRRAVVRLRGRVVDTLFTWELRGQDRRLEAEGAPSLTVKPPFSPQVRWAALPGGGLIRYDPPSRRLVHQDPDGNILDRTPAGWKGTPVTPGDREWWIENEIPSEFMGRRVFEPLREVARRELQFPDTLPPVLALEADDSGAVWAKRSLPVAGEIWMRVTGPVRGTAFRLPPGRELLAVTESFVFALARDDFDAESVEAYDRPR